MGTTRRAVLKGTAAFAGLAAVQASGLAGTACARNRRYQQRAPQGQRAAGPRGLG